MPRTRRPYSAELRHRLVELARGGQRPEELARKFEPSANATQNWMVQAAWVGAVLIERGWCGKDDDLSDPWAL
jgi:transposase-like protein